jgi:TatA/E family protein of Tat protein translocase
VLLLFGGRKLPELARSMGQAKKEFENGTRTPASAPPAGDPTDG